MRANIRVLAVIPALSMALLWLAGCAMSPESRTLDTAGVEPARYNQDLYNCKNYASQYVWEQGIDKTGNMMVGAVLGGAVAVATGGILSPRVPDAMAVGALVGGVANAANASSAAKIEPIVGESAKFLVTDCMRDKGYPVVQGSAPRRADGGNLPIYLSTQAVQTPSQPLRSISPLSLLAIAAPQASTSNAGITLPATAQRFRDKADRLSRLNSCSTPVTALQAGATPSSESYTSSCANGRALVIRCERGVCKVLSR